jgi:hypothetical protein
MAVDGRPQEREMTRDTPAVVMTERLRATCGSIGGMLGLVLRIDGRRPASWISFAMTAAVGCLSLIMAPPQATLAAWASGVAAAAVAFGERPRASRTGPCDAWSAGACDLLQALERLAWPLAGAAGGWLVLQGWGMSPSTVPWAAAAGVGMAGLLFPAFEAAGAAAADAATAVFLLAVLAGTTLGHTPWLLAGAWAVAAWVSVPLVSRADRRASLAREAVVAGLSPGSSELRRWMLRGLMVAMLVAMVRWLLSTEPHTERYGLVGMLASASLILPEALRRGGVAERQSAVGPSQGWTLWRLLALQAMPAVIALWPLLVAALVTPTVRGGAAAGVACLGVCLVPAVAAPLAAAVRRRLLDHETAFSAGVVLVGLAAIAIRAWEARQAGRALAAFPWDS